MDNKEQRQYVTPDINILRQAIYEAMPYWRAKVDEIIADRDEQKIEER